MVTCLPAGRGKGLPGCARSRVARQNFHMEYFTYILVSSRNGDLYVGSTENIENRISLHNKGRVRSTKSSRPWKLLEVHSFKTRGEAFRCEKFLKTHQQKDLIKKRCNLK